jgi:acyl-CoA hydrolase
MEAFALVRPEHLNHFGFLFGGQLLKWVDEYAWLAASRDFPQNRLLTRALERIDFKQQVANGSILRFTIEQMRRGNSSVIYKVEVSGQAPEAKSETAVFSTIVTFVAVDKNGRKMSLSQ